MTFIVHLSFKHIAAMLALFAGLLYLSGMYLDASEFCVPVGPWQIEPSPAFIVVFLGLVSAPLLIVNLLQLTIEAKKDYGFLFEAVSAAFTPAAVMLLVSALPGCPGSAALKWFIAFLLLVATLCLIPVLWNRLMAGRFAWATREVAFACYYGLGMLCILFMVLVGRAGYGTCEYFAAAQPLTDGLAAQAVLSDEQLWDDDTWDSLDTQGKLERLSAVVAAECARLNVKEPPTLEAYKLRTGLMGFYNEKRNTICLDTGVLAEGGFATSFGLICHECAHAFQTACVSDPSVAQGSAWPWPVDEQTLAIWADEGDSYVDIRETPEGYILQDSEFSARAWEDMEVKAMAPAGQAGQVVMT